MKSIFTGLLFVISASSFASPSFESRIEIYNMLLQAEKITAQDFTDLVFALNPSAPVEFRSETREERIERWESLLSQGAMRVQDFNDLVEAQDALEL